MKRLALLGLAALLIVSTISIVPAAAEEPSMEGKIVKRAGETTLYYIGVDGNRYIFPNEKTYKSWFVDFSDVDELSDEELSQYPLTGNIRYRPGVLLIKIQTDPKVYAVSKNGVLRWIKNERLAKRFYGDFWNQLIDDVSAAFFTNYSIGEDIDEDEDFNPDQEVAESETIDDNRGQGKRLGLSKRGRRASSARAKTVVCHKGRSIVIGSPAVPAHLAHGDTEGRCDGEGDGDKDEELDISNIQKEKTDTTASISWLTNLLSTSRIEYATENIDTASSSTVLSDDTLVTSHLFELINLTPSTTYFFILSSTDGDGNTATSSEKTFDTKETEEPEDVTPPIISELNVTVSTSTATATISWLTDELSSSAVEYATSSLEFATSTSSLVDLTLVLEHSLELIDLATSTTYFFKVSSEDDSGNTASTTQDTFIVE